MNPAGEIGNSSKRSALAAGTEGVHAYLFWAWWIGVAFFSVYPATNWLASQRSHALALYVPLELAVPLVPEFIWAYLSMYVLFLTPLFLLPAGRMPSLGKQLIAGTLASGLLFVLFPAELGFARVLPPDPLHASIYATMFSLDRPYNLVPSLHLVFSAAIAFACADVASAAVRAILLAWLAAIALSTVLVHQHHLVDVASAFLLVHFLRRKFKVSHA
jgi:membrane-associated phospholipid phosphatase